MPVYYRIYQDRESLDYNSYIAPLEDLDMICKSNLEDIKEGTIDLPIVIIPVEMSEEELNNLPEFTGY